MNEILNKIPEICYSNELKKVVFRLSPNNTNSIVSSIYKLINCELTDSSFKEIHIISVDAIRISHINNKELRARIKDFLFQINDQDKIKHIEEAVEEYIDVYKQTKEVEYLNRAFTLVRKVKSIFKNRLEEFCQFAIEEIKNKDSSYEQLTLIETSCFLNPSKFKLEFDDFFKNLLKINLTNNNYSEAKNFIKILYELKLSSNEEYKIDLALCLESEADYYTSQKKENEYYPSILAIYTDSLKTIKDITVSTGIKQRLEKKIKNEQLIYSEMLQKSGISLTSNSNIRELVQDLKVEDFASGYQTLLSIPVIKTETINASGTNSEGFSFSLFFKDYVRISNKGTVTGITDEQGYKSNLSRDIYRNRIISIIKEIKYIMDFDKLITKELLFHLIEKSESKFIPRNRTHLFIEGIYEGFNNNFILASHLLIPQIENSLKYIIEQNGGNTTRQTDEIQNDNMLGGILKEKMLNDICDEDLLIELNNFLIDGNSVNFRNQICHGLMEPFMINYYGIYLWWLTLKMVIQTDEYFKFNSTK